MGGGYVTNLASIGQVLWDLLGLYGRDPRPIFKEAGLDPAKMRKPGARYRADALERAWALASNIIDDPCFGLRAAEVWSPSSMGALGYAMLASENLRTALRRMERYHKVIIGWQFIETAETGDEFRIKLNTGPTSARVHARMDALMSVILEICRRGLGQRVAPVRVALMHRVQACERRYREVFGTQVESGAQDYMMALSLQVVEKPLLGADKELVAINERIMSPYLKRLKGDPFLTEVKGLIVRHLPSGNLTDEAVAQRLFMSSRSLQRRLKERGTTFNRLASQIRYDLARKYLARKDASMAEISFMLGFSDLTSFSRAFKGWAGVPPRKYRKECPKPGRPAKAARTKASARKKKAAKERKAVRTKKR